MIKTAGLLLTVALVACAASEGEHRFERTKAGQIVNSSRAEVVFEGMCDASGAVAVGKTRFVIADDEDNILRMYDLAKGGAALRRYDVSPDLGLSAPTKNGATRSKKSPEELDIEAATASEGLAYWLSSHGRSKSGKYKPARFHFFATTLPDESGDFHLVGEAFVDLVAHLQNDSRFARFKLDEAAQLPPKAHGGLNIEGMTARTEGGVWIGLRNPTYDGKALLFSLNNPEGVVQGEPPEFGDPILLDLGGQGVRGLSFWQNRFLVISGNGDGGVNSALYIWDPRTQLTARQLDFDAQKFNPEAFFTPDERSEFLLISDDGARLIDDEPCKDLKDPSKKSFRGRWFTLS